MGSLMNGRGLSSDWNRHGLRQRTARPSGGITQQRIDFCMQQHRKHFRAGARKLLAVDGRTQTHHPIPCNQGIQVASDTSTDLDFYQRAGH